MSGTDKEINSFISIYKSVGSSLSASAHIHPEVLSSYILYEMGDDDNKLIPVLKNKIKAHLNECSVCKDEYDNLVNEYNDVRDHINTSIVNNAEPITHTAQTTRTFLFLRLSSFRYASVTLLVLIIGYFGLFYFSSFQVPDFKKNIFTEENNGFYKTRGRTSQLFQRGLNSIENGDYEDAIQFLSDDIRKHQNERSIFYSYYIAGITYLKAAESDFIGLFRSYDKESVNMAIANLKEAIKKNNSGDYENLKLDSYYYMGRAYLLNDDLTSAKSCFQKVIDGRGRYSKESIELIGQMEKI
jgi:tetratricopeptide (TPR) repeat protein